MQLDDLHCPPACIRGAEGGCQGTIYLNLSDLILHLNSTLNLWWLFLQANYGKKDKECVAAIKQIYADLKLEDKFKEYEAQTYKVCGYDAM